MESAARPPDAPRASPGTWGTAVAATYDETSAARFDPAVLDPTVDLLAELAGDGRALELAVGTGRVALPLAARGVPVVGIDLSEAMLGVLRAKSGSDPVDAVHGDMTSTRVAGSFTLVYLVFNSINNVTTQDEQVAVFASAADHLEPGGSFVIEVGVPQLRRLPPGSLGRVFAAEPHYVGMDTFDEGGDQITWSHHWREVDGDLVRHVVPFRYVWPSELDLMARLAGLVRRDRWADWRRTPFDFESTGHVTLYEKPTA